MPDRVEHIMYRIRGVVRRYIHSGRYAEVEWDDEPAPSEEGRRFLDTRRAEGGWPVRSTTPTSGLRYIDAVTELGELVSKGVWPTEEDIGRGVVYTPYPGAQAEDGVITGFNDAYVFVRYKDQHPSATGKATRREDLRWLSGRA